MILTVLTQIPYKNSPLKQSAKAPPVCWTLLTLLLAFLLTGCVFESSSPDPGTVGDGRFNSIIEGIVSDSNVPALTVTVIRDNQVVESASVGVRSFEADVPVSEQDQWQIGSVTKAITATLAARLVDLDMLTWDTRIDDSLSEHLDQINDELHDITLAELLQHRSGMRRGLDTTATEENNPNDRLSYVLRGLEDSPVAQRGEFSYSNLGYVTAGVMIEKATGMRWEDALQTYLFSELGIIEYGFGIPDPGPGLSQPVGHYRRTPTSANRFNDYWVVVPQAEYRIDWLKLNGPAGSVFITQQEYQKFQQLHLDGANNRSNFLTANSFKRIQQPGTGQDYAMGWFNEESEVINELKIQEPVLTHGGSIGIWTASSTLLPDRNISIFMASNSGQVFYVDVLEVILKRWQVIE